MLSKKGIIVISIHEHGVRGDCPFWNCGRKRSTALRAGGDTSIPCPLPVPINAARETRRISVAHAAGDICG